MISAPSGQQRTISSSVRRGGSKGIRGFLTVWGVGVSAPNPCVVRESTAQKSDSAENSKVGVKISLVQPPTPRAVFLVPLYGEATPCAVTTKGSEKGRKERESQRGRRFSAPIPGVAPREPRSAQASEALAPHPHSGPTASSVKGDKSHGSFKVKAIGPWEPAPKLAGPVGLGAEPECLR